MLLCFSEICQCMRAPSSLFNATSQTTKICQFLKSYLLFLVAAMTVSNGDTNGENGHSNGHSQSPVLEKGSWTIGLINSKYKYLSAETFGFKINANGKTMKKKQV